MIRPRPADPDRAIDAVAAFVRRHQVGAWRFLRVLGCRGLEAEAIAQDALVLAVQKGIATRPDAEAAAFLRQTCKHLWLRTQRADRRRAERHAAAAEILWRRDLGHDDGAGWLTALAACLGELPERSRRALDATYRDGLSRGELAEELGIGEHGVRTLLQRLRAALRTCIERRRQA
ncbi:MAG: sigma-70 family RNA polymerase sigma factor [Planctomycetes bacterium]|nr:sigma-70 family RNA polymerase sigma factor [Planctomycetota bacterium]